MQISTMSVVVGGTACNAKCPFCVARQTPTNGLGSKSPEAKFDNFPTAIKFAEQSGVSTVLLTGKGEPTIWPNQVSDVLVKLFDSKIAFREMQTNAILLKKDIYVDHLKKWRSFGLNTIAISVVSYDDEKNKRIYIDGGSKIPSDKPYPHLPDTIAYLRSFGFSIRLSCIMNKGFIDTPAEVDLLAKFAKANKVAQVTLIPVTTSVNSEDPEAFAWAKDYRVNVNDLRDYLDSTGSRLLILPHGAVVYDYNGQNVCLSNCLTETTDINKIRQLIYFLHDGSLRYSWQYEGARIL